MTETNEQRMSRLAEEERAMTAIRSLCDSYANGAMSFRTAVKLVEDVIDEQAARIVRVGIERHSPEVRT